MPLFERPQIAIVRDHLLRRRAFHAAADKAQPDRLDAIFSEPVVRQKPGADFGNPSFAKRLKFGDLFQLQLEAMFTVAELQVHITRMIIRNLISQGTVTQVGAPFQAIVTETCHR